MNLSLFDKQFHSPNCTRYIQTNITNNTLFAHQLEASKIHNSYLFLFLRPAQINQQKYIKMLFLMTYQKDNCKQNQILFINLQTCRSIFFLKRNIAKNTNQLLFL
ncbi:hypothetical protein ABPG72_002702 [Tetrahymena utriculariae]